MDGTESTADDFVTNMAEFAKTVSATVSGDEFRRIQEAMSQLSDAMSHLEERLDQVDDIRYTLEKGGTASVIDSVDFENEVEENLRMED